MDSGRVLFEKQTQTVESGRKKTVWANYYGTWADFPAASVKEQTDIHNRSLTEAMTVEVRICSKVRSILLDVKGYRVSIGGRKYTIAGAEQSRKKPGWVRILVSRTG